MAFSEKIKIREIREPVKIKHLIFSLRKYEREFDKDLKEAEETVEKLIGWMERKLKSENTFLFVAEIENKIVGYIFGWIARRSKNYWKTQKFGYICDLFVEINYHGFGIGKSLLEKAEEWFKEKGINKLCLEVYAKNPAQNFYEKMGYEKLSIHMVKELDSDF